MADLEERMTKVEGILEEVRTRLNHLEERLGRLEERLDRQFLWLMGVILTMWVTLILTILFRR